MVSVLIYAIRTFSRVLTFLLIGQAFLSWFVRDPYSSAGKLYYALARFTDPIVAPAKAFLHKIGADRGMIDFSLLLTILFIELIEAALVRMLLTFA